MPKNNHPTPSQAKYITLQKLSDLTGYSHYAIYGKVKTGVWLANKHWKKAPDGRLMFNILEVEKWIES